MMCVSCVHAIGPTFKSFPEGEWAADMVHSECPVVPILQAACNIYAYQM